MSGTSKLERLKKRVVQKVIPTESNLPHIRMMKENIRKAIDLLHEEGYINEK